MYDSLDSRDVSFYEVSTYQLAAVSHQSQFSTVSQTQLVLVKP